VAQFNGAPAGQTVFHLHMHIVPRYEGEALAVHAGGQAEPEALAALQARIVARMAG
jgi:histidine triad (HIT) family protein